MTDQTQALISLTLYAVSIIFYNYHLEKEVRTINFLASTWIVRLQVIFLALLGIIPGVNTFICILILFYLKLKRDYQYGF